MTTGDSFCCETGLVEYCDALGLPGKVGQLIELLQQELTATAMAVDAGFPANAELAFDADGALAFDMAVRSRMHERHLLDILRDGTFWTRFTR